MATNDVSVELDDFGGSKENFLIPKKKKKKKELLNLLMLLIHNLNLTRLVLQHQT